MMFLMQCIIATVIFLTVVFTLYVKWVHKYWARRNVPYIEPNSVWGNMENPVWPKYGLKFDIKNVHDELKRQRHKYGGMFIFTDPCYVPVDPELIKCVLTKDFQHFVGRGIPYNEKKDPLSGHLFNLDGDDWRNIRVKVTPTFTSGKMKMMYSTLLDCGVPMIEHIDELVKNQKPLNIKEILACYTTDIIGSCAFGLECNSFKDPDAEFRKCGRRIFEQTLTNSVMQLLSFAIPALNTFFHVRSVPMDLEEFFVGAIENIMDNRKVNNVKRNDFVQMLLEINQKAEASGQEILTLQQIAAQAFVFFLAGFETSSTTMTFCLHELAFNQDVQDKLRDEVRETMKLHGGKLTYDGIKNMKYMDQVVNETLRKYPPVPFLVRECTLEYKVPDTDVVLEKGTKVLISTLGLHRDEEYYPNPEKFDPERFTEENKTKWPTYAFLPFGEGPRVCVGLRFGVMQTKTGLSMMLSNYRILPAPGETYNFELEPKSIILTKKGTLMLTAERLSS